MSENLREDSHIFTAEGLVGFKSGRDSTNSATLSVLYTYVMYGNDLAEYESRRECVRKASESSGVASCSETLTSVYSRMYDTRHYTVHLHADTATAADTCTSVDALPAVSLRQWRRSRGRKREISSQ